MLILNPGSVSFAGRRLDNVAALTVDRAAEREVVERGDGGPHATFADAPEQRVTITIVQHLERDSPDPPRPGQLGALACITATGSSDAGRLRLTAQAVVLRVTHAIAQRRGATRSITMVAVSASGADDPVTVTAL